MRRSEKQGHCEEMRGGAEARHGESERVQSTGISALRRQSKPMRCKARAEQGQAKQGQSKTRKRKAARRKSKAVKSEGIARQGLDSQGRSEDWLSYGIAQISSAEALNRTEAQWHR